MMTRYGLTGKQWAPNDLIHDASEVAGTELSGFFSHYIASREHLPVKQCLADAGFDAALADYGGEAFISFQINPTASARVIREKLTPQHKPRQLQQSDSLLEPDLLRPTEPSSRLRFSARGADGQGARQGSPSARSARSVTEALSPKQSRNPPIEVPASRALRSLNTEQPLVRPRAS